MDVLQFRRMLGCGIVLALLFTAGGSFAAPNTMTYQGTLAGPDGNPIADGPYSMEFSIWDASAGGAKLWEETGHLVSVANGAFAVELGAATPLGTLFDSGAPRWLEVAANTGAGMGIFSPRVALTGVPWAAKAETAATAGNADTVDGSHAADFAPVLHLHNLQDLGGAVTDAQVPDDIHINNADNAGNAATAGNADTLDSKHAADFAATLHSHDGADITSGKIDNARLNTGTGNGLDADMVDGKHSTAFAKAHTGAIYRWAVFSSYDQGGGWMAGNNAALFGGVNPSNWTDNNATAAQMSSDKEVLRTLFTQKGYGGKNATVVADTWYPYSSTNGKVATVLFRVKNTTASPINWTLQFYYTCYGSWNEWASVAMNGGTVWVSGGANASAAANIGVTLTVPGNRTSTIIVVSTSGTPSTTRSLILAFFNNSLQLPAGLEYVDDLDTATGGWEQ